MVRATGYYERLQGCDTKGQRYLRIGPITETAPLESKAVWTEVLPPLKPAEKAAAKRAAEAEKKAHEQRRTS
ncbi:hypothetical protein ACIO3O_22905 [Streptomyces sp. NPDC087440]|uniref:hypothetical protein n=1 Tax=Streptomyces sp. NPDC087440 TaxID=3365790 RepID=UPI0038109AE5